MSKEPCIIHETPDVLVVNKPAGFTVHRAPGRSEPTLVDWLLERYPELTGVGEHPDRPGIVHRLDKGTSGVLIVARNAKAFAFLKKQFQERLARKEYRALVWRVMKEEEGTITKPITRSRRGGFRMRVARPTDAKERAALTVWSVRERFADWTLLAVFPKTGRTHQIRVHLASVGHPVAGDWVYAFSNQPTPPGLARMFLHAAALTITLPRGDKVCFEAALPGELTKVLAGLRTV